MMGLQSEINKKQIEMISLEQLVPENHLVRKLEKAIDLSFIYEMVKDLYSNFGARSIDPAVLIKLNIIQYTFGIRSMRQTIKEIEVNNAYRWYIGYNFHERIPHFTTFGKNYSRRFEGTDLFERIFTKIIEEIIKNGFIDEESVFIDGTHIKANANKHKYINTTVKKSAKYYEEELQREIEEDREKQGKKPLKEKEEPIEPEMKSQKTSTTDPNCEVFHKGEHKKEFAYLANTACDKNNFILDVEITAGNLHDSTVFPKLYPRLIEKYLDIKNVVMYDGRTPILPYKRPMTKAGFFKKYEYVYDEFYDCYICPNNKILNTQQQTEKAIENIKVIKRFA